MRVLLLHRQPFGGIATLTGTLAASLRKLGDEVAVVEASAWIPNETSIAVSKSVNIRLRELGKDFEIVHAFGYRAAWACSDAFSYKEAWLYTAYGMPKTTHRVLIDKLNEGQAGYCSSYSVRDELSGAGAIDLLVRYPADSSVMKTSLDRASARAQFELRPDLTVVGASGQFVLERGFDAFISALDEVWSSLPEAQFLLAGEGIERTDLIARISKSAKPDRIKLLGRLANPADFYRACDLFVVPSRGAGFSLAAAEAMTCGTAVMLRSEGGLPRNRSNT